MLAVILRTVRKTDDSEGFLRLFHLKKHCSGLLPMRLLNFCAIWNIVGKPNVMYLRCVVPFVSIGKGIKL